MVISCMKHNSFWKGKLTVLNVPLRKYLNELFWSSGLKLICSVACLYIITKIYEEITKELNLIKWESVLC